VMIMSVIFNDRPQVYQQYKSAFPHTASMSFPHTQTWYSRSLPHMQTAESNMFLFDRHSRHPPLRVQAARKWRKMGRQAALSARNPQFSVTTRQPHRRLSRARSMDGSLLQASTHPKISYPL